MSNYLKQIKELVSELEQHPKIFIHSFKTFPSFDIATLQTIEKKLSHCINKDLTRFFSTTNGLELAWKFYVNPSEIVFQKRNHTKHFNVDGWIKIPSLGTSDYTSGEDVLPITIESKAILSHAQTSAKLEALLKVLISIKVRTDAYQSFSWLKLGFLNCKIN